MKRLFTGILFISAALLVLGSVTGCKVAMSTGPIGVEAVKLNPEEWNGIWQDPVNNGFVAVRVADADQGILEAAGIETRDDGLELKKLRLHVRQANSWMFLSLESPDRPGNYFWWRIKRSGEAAILWAPHWDRISQLVKEGKLPGKQVSENVLILDELDPRHYEVLTSESSVVADWENPVMLIRAKKD
ncbi:MAG: hypothetical protein WBH86_13700 [Thermogutta sp.]|nr:hypothetical protein [Thermogutta sp.]HPZ82432.1 hypothetical protein [Thermogutta sp.]HQF12479.1 hypothetical protein [Thermogutta sp.]